ncbi:hypothetical protein LOC67_11045 [Stieleria sp. JC731]|uniref:hypothetical protein n=1 Tax=Pirellulaceae TaxID=2691357 RepID=UPI001E446EDF|nr:hypothetical protein [Stieleria sp. JC731]MCC9601083.1 hypothetical protein [Stieleria sp. JC731]
MKRLVSLALTLSIVAALGAALQGMSPNEEPTESGKSCCQKFAVAPEVVASLPSKDSDSTNSDSTKCGVGLCPISKETPSCCEGSATTNLISTDVGNEPQCKNCKEQCSTCAGASKAAETAKSDQPVSTRKKAGSNGGMGQGHAGDLQHQKDHQEFFFLIEHRDSIRRTVNDLPNGVETLTESDDDEVASMIQSHVEAMYVRMENANPIRMRDPLFREVFMNAKKIKMEVEHTDHGVRVTETSDDPYAVKLIQAHSKVVSLWIKNGYSELPKNHAAPAK